MVAEFLSPDSARWREALDRLPHDFYHLPDYLIHAGRHEGGEPVAFHARDGAAEFLAPLLLRPLPPELAAPAGRRDAITPYGYPTPLLAPAGDSDALRRFLSVFQSAAAELGLVTAFFRLHPLLPLPEDVLAEHGTLVRHGETVNIDLTQSAEALDAQVKSSRRRDIRLLVRDGFRAEVDDWRRFDDFIAMYLATMSRLNADAFYHFSRDYFLELREALGDRLHLCTVAAPDGRTAAAALVTECGDFAQYHLGGTADDFLAKAPTKLLVAHARDWARARGLRSFHLGGGVGGRRDSLFEFKARYSDLVAPFHTFRMTIDPDSCAELERRRHRHCGEPPPADRDYFPPYRRPCR